jgi:hypothetical protein
VYGQPQPDGSWAGWIVFFPFDGSSPIATDRETTQRTFGSLGIWATGLTLVYLEGALVRALRLEAAPLILADLNDAEDAALEDAQMLPTAADVERTGANIDEAQRRRHTRMLRESEKSAS